MAAITEFTTLMESTGPAWARGPMDMVNETTKRTYTIPRLRAGKSEEEMVHGGDSIQDRIFFDLRSTYRRYNINETMSYPNYQTGTNWTVNWAFATATMTWTKHELGLNKEKHTGKYRAQVYKKVMRQKHQNLMTDICNGMEDEIWAVPNNATMELTPTDGTPRQPYSLPCFITDHNDGQETFGFTNVMGINPATQTGWANQVELYTAGGAATGWTAATAIGASGIFSAFSQMKRSIKFDPLPKYSEYSEKATMPTFIACSSQGMANYEHALRINQDTFRGVGKTSGEDPDYDQPTFNGIPLVYVEALDAAALYADVNAAPTALFSENAAGTEFLGPRYWFVNGEYLVTAVHDENYMMLDEPFKLSAAGQPFTMVQVADMWNNCYCRSRRRQGIVSPGADVVVQA